jgi:hypothetical protein
METRKAIERVAETAWPGARLEWTLGYSRHCAEGTPHTVAGHRLVIFHQAGGITVVDGATLAELLPAILKKWRRKLVEDRQRKQRASLPRAVF